ncbi:hypothetical protein KAM380_043300 [Aeromonas caviae]|nr:hypothetical protein KAM380_043300 [Aeromonas caviae]
MPGEFVAGGYGRGYSCTGPFAGMPAPKEISLLPKAVLYLWERASPRKGRCRSILADRQDIALELVILTKPDGFVSLVRYLIVRAG